MTILSLVYLVLFYYLICWGGAIWLKSILERYEGYYFIRNRAKFYGDFNLEVLLNPLTASVFIFNLGKYWNMRFSIYQSLAKWHKLKAPLDTKTILMLKEEFGTLYDQEINEFNRYR
jgi:hypothetical protein